MKKWRKWLAAGFAAAAVSVSSFMLPVTAGTQGYERWSTVAQEERIQAAYADEKDTKPTDKVDPKAWKKINGVCYNGSGKKIPGAITWGIDVSEWQEKIDWKKVKKAGVDFAMVRIAHGVSHLDKYFDYNMKQTEAAGVPVGTYVYSLATTTEQALEEAQLAIEKMKGYKVSYPVVFDLEYSKMGELTKKQVSNLALTFCKEVKKAGYYPMVYCNTDWYDNEVDWKLLSGYDVWIARYGDTIQAPSRAEYEYTIWQATDGDGGGRLNPTKGLIDGIPQYSNVDIDFGYVDYTKKITPRKNPVSTYKPSAHPETDIDGNPYGKKNGWIEKDGKTYYYKNNKKITSWHKLDGHFRYFDPKTGEMLRAKLIPYASKYYYVDKNGARAENKWITYKGKKYYMGPKGVALKGVQTMKGKTYYFHNTKSYMLTNKRSMNKAGDIYYFGSDGVRCENGMYKVKLDGKTKTFYFHKNGKAHKGWLTLNGKKYYFYNGKAMESGTRAESITLTSSTGVVSVFDRNGVCIKQYKDDMQPAK